MLMTELMLSKLNRLQARVDLLKDDRRRDPDKPGHKKPVHGHRQGPGRLLERA